MNLKIGIIRGDGIGPEVVTEAVKVLDKAAEIYGHTCDYTELLMGGASIDVHGVPLTDETIEMCIRDRLDTGVSFQVPFRDFTLTSRMYDLDVSGYHNGRNRLHLFDVESVDESIIEDGITFDKTQVAKNLTLFLYPDDSDRAGNLLRIYQQYFMVSSAAQLILKECKDRGVSLRKLHEHVAIQINDTHPSMVIPELIRLLVQEQIDFNEAVEIVQKTCAYTNHTILAEALEKWPLSYLEQVRCV